MRKRKEHTWLISSVFTIFLVLLVAGFLKEYPANLSLKFSYLAILPAASISITLYLLYLVSRHKSNIKSVLWFCIFLVAMVFWGLADLFAFLANNPETGMLARNLIVLPALIGATSFYVFLRDLTSNRKSPPSIGLQSLIFFVSMLYTVVHLRTDLFINRDLSSLIPRFWGWEVVPGPLIIYYLYSQVFLVLAAILLVRFYRTRKLEQEKRQAKIFLIGFMVPIIGISITNIIPSLLGLPFFIPIDSLYQATMAAILVYGLNKYQIFSVDPAKIANNILETMTESVIVTTLDFKLQYLNKNAMALLNTSDPSDSKEESIKQFFNEDEFKLIKETAGKTKLIEKSQKFAELHIQPKRGSEAIPVEVSLSSAIFEKKTAAGYVFVISDISELQQAYAKLAEQEKKVEKQVIERTEQLYAEHAKLEASISGLPIGFIMLDESMRVTEQNAVAKKLFSTRENNRWYVEDALEEMGVERKLLKSTKLSDIIDVPEVERGNRILHIIISPIIREGKMLGRVVLIEDITAQKAAEKERNEFIVTASHEIRTPLSVIQGNLSNVLDMQKEISSKVSPLIEKAYNASNQISALFKDILIVSDIESSARPKPTFETKFSLVEAIKEVIDSLDLEAEEKSLEVDFASKIKIANLKGDRDEVKESIYKLVDNAIKFTKKGKVTVSLSKKADSAYIKVKDTGGGISKAEEQRLFKKFVRLDNSLKREVGGVGLGLYIAKELAERNGGSVKLEESSSKGSTFSLEFPLS